MAMEALNIFRAYRAKSPNLILFISRDVDSKFFGYYAQRQGNELVGDKVQCRSIICPEWKQEQEVAPLLLQNFFGMKVTDIPGTHAYTATINAFSERTLTLNLKKNSAPDKNDGVVTSKGTLQLESGVTVANVQVFNIHTFMVFDDRGIIPNVTKVVIHGCAAKQDVQHLSPDLFKKHCVPLSDTQCLVSEEMVITEAMRKRFDAASLAKQWLTQAFK